MSAVNDRAPRPENRGATGDQSNHRKATTDVALFVDGDDLVISTPRRGRAPMGVNPAVRGTSAVIDTAAGVWRITRAEATNVVANLRARGLTVATKVHPWIVVRDNRTPDPLPECVECATPYRRLGVVPRHCVACGDRLELQTVRVLERITTRAMRACGCGCTVDQSAMFCGDCGAAVDHG